MPTISSLSNLFITAQEGFTTTLSSSISSGAATVPLNSVAGYSNGDTIALVIDPADAAKKQVVVGTVDSSGSQLTGCIWTEGTNQAHAAGATAVDYVTATHQAAMVKGAKVSLNNDGTLKDSIVTTAKISDSAVTTAKVADGAITNAKLSTTTGELGGVWQSWTPTFTNLNIGSTGSVDARYTQIGKTVHINMVIDLDGTGVSVGDVRFTPPVSAATYVIASGTLYDFGSVTYAEGVSTRSLGTIRMQSADSFRPLTNFAAGTNYVAVSALGASVPHTWGAGDHIVLSGTYEAA